ncbi:hypothetical protein GCM10027517_29980 [Phycicoccus ginsengisoli]
MRTTPLFTAANDPASDGPVVVEEGEEGGGWDVLAPVSVRVGCFVTVTVGGGDGFSGCGVRAQAEHTKSAGSRHEAAM